MLLRKVLTMSTAQTLRLLKTKRFEVKLMSEAFNFNDNMRYKEDFFAYFCAYQRQSMKNSFQALSNFNHPQIIPTSGDFP